MALRTLSLRNTRCSDLTPLAGLTDLQRLFLAGTQVNDLSPIASLTALQTLDLDGSQIADLNPLAGMTHLQDAVSRSALIDRTSGGLSYVHTPASQIAPFDQFIQLDKTALTVETINHVRKQRGLPAHIPEGYERPKNLPISAP